MHDLSKCGPIGLSVGTVPINRTVQMYFGIEKMEQYNARHKKKTEWFRIVLGFRNIRIKSARFLYYRTVPGEASDLRLRELLDIYPVTADLSRATHFGRCANRAWERRGDFPANRV
jgi:hypothetical protein